MILGASAFLCQLVWMSTGPFIEARGLKNLMDLRFYNFDDFLKSEKQNLQQINNKNS
jgi:hypothetical protein